MSAHERGLELLYKIWPEVRKAVPDATLDVYYGWTGFDEVNKDNPERMGWKEKLLNMQSQLADKGVTNHGKIGHGQIVREIYKSGVWAYPSPFPEVYCITGVKAQAGGAWPVVSDYAALRDTVQYGDKQPMPNYDEQSRAGKWEYKDLEEYRDKLIHRLKNPPTREERTEMMKWARNNMSWEATAKGWSDEFSK
jgi:glycosyltransferase involved in cell wall biosynthesis